jgi:ParB family chromosome partitioning protein
VAHKGRHLGEELAEDIARRGLLQSLTVRPVLADDGSEIGKFEIPAVGRRFQGLSLLVKQKRLSKKTPIPCIVRDANSTILAEDDSLAENMQRGALHPLDQFRAFVTPQVINPDHERQVQVWDAIRSPWNKEHYQIRCMLTETSVRASDRRAAFVGVKVNAAAGGTMLHDLFQGDDGGWLEDPAPLDRLVSEKLKAEAEVIAAEGWKWIEVSLDLPYGYSHGLRRLSGDPAPMTDDEGAAHAKLLTEYRALEEEYEGQDEFPEEIDARLGKLDVAMEKFEARPLIFDAVDIARAGAFVTLDRYGELAGYRGFVRPEDEPRADVDVHSGEQVADGQGAELSAGEQHGWCRPRHGDHLC